MENFRLEYINRVYQSIKNKFVNSPFYWRTLVALLFVALIIKGFVIYFSYKNLNPWENVLSYLASDLLVIFFAHLLVTINFWIKKRKFRLLIDLIIFSILVIFIVDIFTIHFFQSRVSVVDALALGSNWSSGFSWIIRLWISAFIIAWIATFILVQKRKIKRTNEWKKMIIRFSLCSLSYVAFYSILVAFNISTHYVENVITLNAKSFKKSDINIPEEDNLSYKSYISNVQWEWKNLNIILVFAESISAIDSANMWWKDNMPKFDEIQKNWITFTNFLTNGTTSDTSHIATLLWVLPLINMRLNNTPYNGYKLIMPALPQFLNEQWYMTTFVSAASLSFLDQRSFLSWAWFQKIIWEEAFEWRKKYTFDAAPDWDLYDRVLEEVKNQTWKYFIWLQTISFHKPYTSPYWKSEEAALRYADDSLYNFYSSLKDLGFFDNWVLIVFWDHRKMNPIEENEYEIFWPNRYTRSVATILWSGIEAWGINSNIIQHTDFYNSIKKLVGSWSVSIDKTYNDIFGEEKNRDWAIINSEFYENNRYTVSSESGDIFLFKNLSNLEKDSPVYDYFSSYVWFEFKDEKNQEDNDSIKFIGHRWATEKAPENTLESFLDAKEQWASWIEFDVSYTKDKQNVVVHWDLLYASSCRNKKVWNYNFEWIRDNCVIQNWERYKNLKKMLELVDWLFDYYFLEIKVYDEKLWEQQTLDAIQTVRELNMLDRVIFISYSDAARKVLDSQEDVIFGRDTFDVNDLDFIWENSSKYFLAPYDMLTPEIIEKARSLWKEVVTYTVNDTQSFQSMKDLWVNIIMTDRLSLLQSYNKRYMLMKKSLKLRKAVPVCKALNS